jgi:hypothetical protein
MGELILEPIPLVGNRARSVLRFETPPIGLRKLRKDSSGESLKRIPRNISAINIRISKEIGHCPSLGRFPPEGVSRS